MAQKDIRFLLPVFLFIFQLDWDLRSHRAEMMSTLSLKLPVFAPSRHSGMPNTQINSELGQVCSHENTHSTIGYGEGEVSSGVKPWGQIPDPPFVSCPCEASFLLLSVLPFSDVQNRWSLHLRHQYAASNEHIHIKHLEWFQAHKRHSVILPH